MAYNVTKDAMVNIELTNLYNEFLADTSADVLTLVNEYLRKKDAWEATTVRYRQEGDIDFSRIHEYKTSGDIFQNIGIRRKGKSHGIVILIDSSGSMYPVYHKVGCQAIVCAKFAQKCGLPYEIYLTDDKSYSHKEIDKLASQDRTATYKHHIDTTPDAVKLVAHSRCNINEQEKQLFSLWMGTLFHGRHNKPTNIRELQSTVYELARKDEKLSHLWWYYSGSNSTPLYNSIVALSYLARRFKNVSKIDNLTTLILSDGEDNCGIHITPGEYKICGRVPTVNDYGRGRALTFHNNSIMVDGVTNRSYTVKDLLSKDALNGLIDQTQGRSLSFLYGYYKKVTGSKLSVIYLSHGRNGTTQFSGYRSFCYYIGAMGSTYGKVTISAKTKNLVARVVASCKSQPYIKFEGLLGSDFTSFISIKDIEKMEMTEQDTVNEVNRIRRDAKNKNKTATQSTLLNLSSKMTASVNANRILARDIADLICRDFEIREMNRVAWFENASLSHKINAKEIDAISSELDKEVEEEEDY